MRIALDAMGTDGAPVSEIAGVIEALRGSDPDLEVILVGDEAPIRSELERYSDYPGDRVSVVHAPDRVLPTDTPSTVIRRKPHSSIVVGLRLQKAGGADAFISAGSTGAVMAASLFILRRLEGVDRPAIGAVLPTAKGSLLLLDAGANVDCKPQQLLQFARLGSVYAEHLMDVNNPRVGLLNIGAEPGKGGELELAAHRLLAESDINFIGNVEGREIILGDCDVLVCDGFVGNVLLKFYESVATFVVELLRRTADSFAATDDLEEVFRVLDYTETGGAPLLGLNGVSIICHGDSPPKAIRNAIYVAARAVRSSIVEHEQQAVTGARAVGEHA
ncbi:MAG: phosphate acyltransferase PlsX [Gemmatimonadetes bacterium]|nr:phosphate acyltransferase PlsX [Gemmatimonadota bacterium]